MSEVFRGAARGTCRASASVLAVCLLTSASSAQTPGGLGGRITDEAGLAATYALVEVVAAADTSRLHGRALTDERGRYAFTRLSPGTYRVRVSRIGFEPHVGAPLEVRAGLRLTHDMSITTAPVHIDALVVGGGSACYPLHELGVAAPDIARLWNEAVKGIEIKRAFLREHRYAVDLRIQTHQDNRLLRDVHEVQERTMVFPDSATDSPPADSAQATGAEAEGGAGTFGASRASSFTLSLPSEQVITDPARLEGYCVEDAVSHSGDGALGIHFRPLDPDRAGVTAEGAVFIEEDDYSIRGLTYHYYSDGDFAGVGEWVYGNIRVPGDVLRLPVRGSMQMQRVPLPLGALIRSFQMQIEYSDYRGFEPRGDT